MNLSSSGLGRRTWRGIEETSEASGVDARLLMEIWSSEFRIVISAVDVAAEAAVFEGMLVGWMTAGSWYEDMEFVSGVRVGTEEAVKELQSEEC